MLELRSAEGAFGLALGLGFLAFAVYLGAMVERRTGKVSIALMTAILAFGAISVVVGTALQMAKCRGHNYERCMDSD